MCAIVIRARIEWDGLYLVLYVYAKHILPYMLEEFHYLMRYVVCGSYIAVENVEKTGIKHILLCGTFFVGSAGRITSIKCVYKTIFTD